MVNFSRTTVHLSGELLIDGVLAPTIKTLRTHSHSLISQLSTVNIYYTLWELKPVCAAVSHFM